MVKTIEEAAIAVDDMFNSAFQNTRTNRFLQTRLNDLLFLKYLAKIAVMIAAMKVRGIMERREMRKRMNIWAAKTRR